MTDIIGPTNKYYISKRFSDPANTRQLIAQKGLLSQKWNLYTVKTRPLMYGNPPPIKKKIASDISLKDVFYEMAQFEANPPVLRVKPDNYLLAKGMRKDGLLLLKQDIPKQDKRYWRNVRDRMTP